VGQACEGASARMVARQFQIAASTVRNMDLRYLERWSRSRRKPALRQLGVDEIHLGKKQKFLTVVSNLEMGEPLWFGRDRKEETLDEFVAKELSAFQRSRIVAACVDMWEPFTKSILKWAPACRIVFDKFHVMQHANADPPSAHSPDTANDITPLPPWSCSQSTADPALPARRPPRSHSPAGRSRSTPAFDSCPSGAPIA